MQSNQTFSVAAELYLTLVLFPLKILPLVRVAKRADWLPIPKALREGVGEVLFGGDRGGFPVKLYPLILGSVLEGGILLGFWIPGSQRSSTIH